MDTQAIQATAAQSAGVEDPVTPMYQMVVEGDLHQRGIGDDPT